MNQHVDQQANATERPDRGEIRTTVSSSQRRTVRVAVDGRLDAVSSMQFRDDLDRIMADEFDVLRVDLASVPFVDSAGLAALVSALKRCRRQGADMEVVRPRSDDAYRVFTLTKFDAVFTVLSPDHD